MRLAVKPRSLLNVGREAVRPWAGPPLCVQRTGRRLAGPLGPKPRLSPDCTSGPIPVLRDVQGRTNVAGSGTPGATPEALFCSLGRAQVFLWGWWLQGFAVCGRIAAASRGKTSRPCLPRLSQSGGSKPLVGFSAAPLVSQPFPSRWSRCSRLKYKPGDCLRFAPADSLSGESASWLASLATMCRTPNWICRGS
jgi:hypothetical protein